MLSGVVTVAPVVAVVAVDALMVECAPPRRWCTTTAGASPLSRAAAATPAVASTPAATTAATAMVLRERCMIRSSVGAFIRAGTRPTRLKPSGGLAAALFLGDLGLHLAVLDADPDAGLRVAFRE